MALTTAQVMERMPDVTYRQIDHWVRKGWCQPTTEGRDRAWPLAEVRIAVVMARLIKHGMHAPNAARIARAAIKGLASQPDRSVIGVKLGDGVSVRIDVSSL